MKLRDYLELKRIKQKDFIDHIEVSPDTMRRILQGRNITIEIGMKIEFATKGKVKCRDILSEDRLKELERFKNF